MFDLFRFKKNNKNGKSYAVARSCLEFKEREVKSGDSNNKVEGLSNSEVAKEINRLETTVRYHNLKVYNDNIKIVKNRRFAIYTFPVILLAVTGMLFAGPDSYETTKTFDTYKKEIIYFEDGMMQRVDDGVTYCFGEIDRTFKDENTELLTNTGSYFNLYILENGEGIFAPFGFNRDQLTFNSRSVDTGVYVLDEINVENGDEINSLYVDLFNNAVKIIKESKVVNNKYKSLLDNFEDNDKIRFVGELVNYEFTGEKEVSSVINANTFRIIASIVTGLYILIFGIPGLRRQIVECEGLIVRNGMLDTEDYATQHRFTELPLEFRSAFIAAETQRINAIGKLAEEYLTPESKEQLLTNFEKKLILK